MGFDFDTDTVTEQNDIISVWFECRSCQSTFPFRTVDEFLDHKKQKHFTEFQTVQCIVFEERKQDESFYKNAEDVETKLSAQDDGDGDGDVELLTENEESRIFSRIIAEPSPVPVSKRELSGSLPHMNLSNNASAVRTARELTPKLQQESELSADFGLFYVRLPSTITCNDPCDLQADLALHKSTQTEGETQHSQSQSDVENHSTHILSENLSPDFSFADAKADADEDGPSVQDLIDPLSENLLDAHHSTSTNTLNPTPKNTCVLLRRSNAKQLLSSSKLVLCSGPVPVVCRICSKPYKNKSALRRHMNSHYRFKKEIRSFKCSYPDCKTYFNTKSELKRHIGRHEKCKTIPKSILNHFKFPDPSSETGRNQSNPLTLTLREWLVEQKSLQDSNVNIIRLDPDPTDREMGETGIEIEAIKVSGKTPIKCKLCNKNLKSAAEVKVHVTHCWLQNKSRHVYCLPCNKTLRSPMELRNHNARIHILESRKQDPKGKHIKIPVEYKCHICSKQYSSISNLNKHVKRHKRERPFVCEICGKAYSMKHELKLHQVTHTDDRPFKCSYPSCTAAFQFKNNLRQHTETHLPKPQNIPKLICCPKEGCSKCFRTKRDLSAHLRTILHTGVFRPKAWRCTQDNCSQVYVNKTSLDRHMIGTHGIGGQLPTFECEICKKTFTWKISKIMHMKSHSEDRPFKCSYDGCDKGYKGKEALVQHVYGKHTGERPFQCELCGKAYYRRCSWRFHMGIHKRSQHTNE